MEAIKWDSDYFDRWKASWFTVIVPNVEHLSLPRRD
jgi:hypothetical protein